jgi:hypothetical protein
MNPSRAQVPLEAEVGVQFRVVFPADDPGLYAELATAEGR